MEKWIVALTNYSIAPTLMKDYPEVESYTRFLGGRQEMQIEVNEKIFKSDNIWYTDSTVFDIFTYNLILGDKKEALKAPNSIVLTEELSMRLFGKKDVIGKQFRLNNSMLTVQGIIETPPHNSENPYKWAHINEHTPSKISPIV